MNGKICFHYGEKWHEGMCHYHAMQMGCQPPLRKLCRVCVAGAGRAKIARVAHGMCKQHARLAKMSDDDKIARPGPEGAVMEDDE